MIKAAILGGIIGAPAPYDSDPQYERAAAVGEGLSLAIPFLGPLAAAVKGRKASSSVQALATEAAAVKPGIQAYHGSPNMLLGQVSANPPVRQFPNPQSELGAFFTLDEADAARYADIHRTGQKGRVYPATVPLKHPKELKWGEFSGLKTPEEARAFKAKLIAEGHDGIIVRNTKGEPIELVSFQDVPLAQQPLPLQPPGIKAYHGSPYDFDRFDSSKIGTGEGAQAYGHGLYFAENENVARQYRNNLAPIPEVKVGGKPITLPRSAFDPQEPQQTVANRLALQKRAALQLGWEDSPETNRMVIDRVQVDINTALHAAIQRGDEEVRQRLARQRAELGLMKEHGITLGAGGKTYEVSIRADADEFLDWDTPLSQQSERTRRALAEIPQFSGGARPDTSHITGGGALALFRNPSAAAESLRKAGLKGIRYRDAGSRPKGDPAAIRRNLEDAIDGFEKWKAQGGTAQHQIDNFTKHIANLRQNLQAAEAAGPGTHNYVVFDDAIIDIMKKYGIALPLAGAFKAWQDQQKPSK